MSNRGVPIDNQISQNIGHLVFTVSTVSLYKCRLWLISFRSKEFQNSEFLLYSNRGAQLSFMCMHMCVSVHLIQSDIVIKNVLTDSLLLANLFTQLIHIYTCYCAFNWNYVQEYITPHQVIQTCTIYFILLCHMVDKCAHTQNDILKYTLRHLFFRSIPLLFLSLILGTHV